MAINRFYNPQRGQYISQFVPTQLPADLMLGIIQNKRKQADAEIARGEQYADALLKVQAIKNSVDEAKLGEYQTKLRDYLNTTVGKVDLASAQGQREYREMLKTFSPLQNKDLSSIQGRYDYAQSIEKEREEMRKDPIKYGEGVYFKSYDLSMKDFLKQKEFNKNYAISSKEHITAGIDRYKYYEDFYNNLVANSSEGSSKISDDLGSAYYKISNEGISYKRIQGRTGEVLATAMNSPAGTQTRREVINEIGLTMEQYNSLSQENKDKIEQETAKRVAEGLMAAGKEKIYSKTGNDKASALNTIEGWKREDRKLAEEAFNVDVTLNTLVDNSMASADKRIQELNSSLTQNHAALEKLQENQRKGIPVNPKDLENLNRAIAKEDEEKQRIILRKNEVYNGIYKEQYSKYDKSFEEIKGMTQKVLQNPMYQSSVKKVNELMKVPGVTKEMAISKLSSEEKKLYIKSQEFLVKAQEETNRLRGEITKNTDAIWASQWTKSDGKKTMTNQDFYNLDPNVQKGMASSIQSNPEAYQFYTVGEDGKIVPFSAGMKATQIVEVNGLTVSSSDILTYDGSKTKGNGYYGQFKVRVPKYSDGAFRDKNGNEVDSPELAATEEKYVSMIAVPGTANYEHINNKVAAQKEKSAKAYLNSNDVNQRNIGQREMQEAITLKKSVIATGVKDFLVKSGNVPNAQKTITTNIGGVPTEIVLTTTKDSQYSKAQFYQEGKLVAEKESPNDRLSDVIVNFASE